MLPKNLQWDISNLREEETEPRRSTSNQASICAGPTTTTSLNTRLPALTQPPLFNACNPMPLRVHSGHVTLSYMSNKPRRDDQKEGISKCTQDEARSLRFRSNYLKLDQVALVALLLLRSHSERVAGALPTEPATEPATVHAGRASSSV